MNENNDRLNQTSEGFGADHETDAGSDPRTAPPEKRYFFDVIGDFFERMTIGIFKFAFYKFPVFIYRLISRRILGFIRAVFWCTVWLFVICAAWLLTAFEAFLEFWRGIWHIIRDLLIAMKDYAGPIWFCIAIAGSVYGLLYVTLKWRAKKKNVPFNGVFSFLRRRKKQNSSNIPEHAPGE